MSDALTGVERVNFCGPISFMPYQHFMLPAENVILNRYKNIDIALIISYYQSTCGKSTLLGAMKICTAVAFSVTTGDVTDGAEP